MLAAGLEEQMLHDRHGWPASSHCRAAASPRASARQFIEMAVNMPEQEPQVGQAVFFDMSCTCSSVMVSLGSGNHGIDQINLFHGSRPSDSQNLAGLHRAARDKDHRNVQAHGEAIIIPGVILSQLEIQTMASAQWALTIYSTLSAMISRDGSE